MSVQGSPESSVRARGGFISVQFYKNVPTGYDSSSASPKYVSLHSQIALINIHVELMDDIFHCLPFQQCRTNIGA